MNENKDHSGQEGKVFYVLNGEVIELEMPSTGYGSGEFRWVDKKIVYAATTTSQVFIRKKN